MNDTLKKIGVGVIATGALATGALLTDVKISPCTKLPTIELATSTIEERITDKTVAEKIDMKALEFVDMECVAKEEITKDGKTYDIEVLDIQKIDGGIAVFARAWKDKQQIGFGADGTVDIERFLIHNPPVLVDDPNGTIVRSWFNEKTQRIETRTLREDPKEALMQTLAHTISTKKEKFDDSKIVKDKIGNTTSTFYPDPNVESTSVDGFIKMGGGTIQTWAVIRANTTATTFSDSGTSAEFAEAFAYTSAGNWNELMRSMFLFDTSAIPDTDTISAATFSVYVTSKADPHNEISFAISTSSPSSNTALATTDFGLGTKFGLTALATDKTYASISTAAYNDWSLNATGIANITPTGVSKFGMMLTQDRDNSSPTWAASTYKHITGYYADQTGTANDPKLVVEHAGAGGSTPPATVILFE